LPKEGFGVKALASYSQMNTKKKEQKKLQRFSVCSPKKPFKIEKKSKKSKFQLPSHLLYY
jgi:hypothetical protein